MKSNRRADRVRVVHVINSLAHGGAEAMLGNLMLRRDRARFESSVVMLIDDRSTADAVRRAEVPIHAIGMRPGVPDPRGLVRLARHLRRERPAVVQTWMDHSNLIGGLAARAALGRAVRVVWGVHHSQHVAGVAKRTTLMTVAACARLSRRVADRIVLVSEASRRFYTDHGFDPRLMEVIPNGFETERFRPDPEARATLRHELGLGPEGPLVGLVARYDPNKDHANFLHAAAQVARGRPDVRFVLCGYGVDRSNTALTGLIEQLGLEGVCLPIGQRGDVERVLAGLDLLVSSSVSEAFPLVLGEAMSCGVPCVATAVGDSAQIIGPCGRLVPPRDPRALAQALTDLLALPAADRQTIGAAARARITERYDITVITRRYEELYLGLLEGRPREGPEPRPAARSAPPGGFGPGLKTGTGLRLDTVGMGC